MVREARFELKINLFEFASFLSYQSPLPVTGMGAGLAWRLRAKAIRCQPRRRAISNSTLSVGRAERSCGWTVEFVSRYSLRRDQPKIARSLTPCSKNRSAEIPAVRRIRIVPAHHRHNGSEIVRRQRQTEYPPQNIAVLPGRPQYPSFPRAIHPSFGKMPVE